MKKSLSAKRPVLNGRGNDGVDYIYAKLKIALFNYYYLVRSDLKRRWKSLSKVERRDAVAGLRYLEDVFKNPAKHFSRAQTQSSWNNRAVQYATEKGLPNVNDAFYIVHGPREEFIENVKHAVYSHDLYSALCQLASNAQNWEYDRTSVHDYLRYQADRFSDEIVKAAKRTQQIVDIMESNPVVRPLKQIVYNLQH